MSRRRHPWRKAAGGRRKPIAFDRAGVEERGMFIQGSPRNLGDLMFSSDQRGRSNRVRKLQARPGGGVCRRTGRLGETERTNKEMRRHW
jgi:hypothetical protein